MNRPKRPEVRSRSAQSSMESTTIQSPHHPRFPPAFKHGMRASTILLPTEDPVEFARLRHEQFATYQPRTRDEANCVELIVKCFWRMERYQNLQAAFDIKVTALAHGDSGCAAGEPAVERHCETDPHRWQHKSMDCEQLEGRLDRRMIRTRDKLMNLQWARRNNLIPGAMDTLPDYRDFERAGDIPWQPSDGAEGSTQEPGPAPTPEMAAGTASGAAPRTPVTPSSDSGNGIGDNWNAAPRRPKFDGGKTQRAAPAFRPRTPPAVAPPRFGPGIPNGPAVLRSQTLPVDAHRKRTGGNRPHKATRH